MRVWCDQDTDSGGWALMLNYLHQGSSNPFLQPRTLAMSGPILCSTTLGQDESANFGVGGSWGHFASGAWAQFDVATVRKLNSNAGPCLHALRC